MSLWGLSDQKSNKSHVGSPRVLSLGPYFFLLYINDFHNSSRTLNFHLFVDDFNLFYANKSLPRLESVICNELLYVHEWLCANKLSLNIEKANFIIFHPPQKKVNYDVNLTLKEKPIKQGHSMNYLSITIDAHLNWKAHIQNLSKKIQRSIGAISKLRHFVNLNILMNSYYSCIYPFLIYGLIACRATHTTQQWNLYSYCRKRPSDYNDNFWLPWTHEPFIY